MLLKRHLPRLGLALTLLCAPLSPAPVWARISSLSSLFVFGDSLSDSGNSKAVSNAATGGAFTFPPSPYFEGRFSNGPVAAEYLWQAFNPGDNSFRASLAGGTNFAIGGSTTGVENFVEVWPVTPVFLKPFYQELGNAWQLGQFGSQAFEPDTSLFLVWLFPNDVFYYNTTSGAGVGGFDGTAALPAPVATEQLIETAVTNITGSINSLAEKGARNFLVVNAPDLGLIPEFLTAPEEQKAGLSALSGGFNSVLSTAVNGLAAARPQLNITLFEIDKLFAEVRNDKESFGLSNVINRCLDGNTVCADPDGFLFWDGSHPTKAAHALIGQRFYEAVYQAPAVPGPLPATAVVVVIGWSRRLRSRIRQAEATGLQASAPKNQP
jgi:phospholipase/lecithinase/hemolysin